MKPGETYRAFLQALWHYQYTTNRAELTEKMSNRIYDCSGGISAYVVHIFQEAQIQPILSGHEIIDDAAIQTAVDRLAIRTPRDRDDLLDFFPTPYPEEWWSILLPHDAIEAKKEHATGLT